MTRTIKTRKGKRRDQKIEDALVPDVLASDSNSNDDDEEDCSGKDTKGKKVKVNVFAEALAREQSLGVDWERTHNHRIPINKKVFGTITYGDVERAIWRSEGMLTRVASALKISVYQVKQILAKYKLLRQDFEEYREAVLDEAEMCLRTKVRMGDTSAMIFMLKCIGKNRGYVEYEKGKASTGSVKMKIVPATEASVKKQKKEMQGEVAPASASANTNVIQFVKAENE